MPALPASSSFTGSTVTEAQFKQAITDQREFLASLLGADGSVSTALATVGALGAGYASKTAAYTLISQDRGRLIDCSGAFTLSLSAASSLGTGFTVAVRNSGSGTITIDPSGSELIDGQATISCAPGESFVLCCTGAAWRTVGRMVTNTFATDEYVKQSFSLFQTFGSLASNASKSVGATNYLIWSSYYGNQWSRGTYYTNMFYTSGSGKSLVVINVGNCRLTIWNYSSSKSMQINLTGVINCANDDTYAFQIRRDGVTVGTYGSYSGRITRTVDFGSFTVAPNSTSTFDLYGSILNGSGGDSLYVNSFTATFQQFV